MPMTVDTDRQALYIALACCLRDRDRDGPHRRGSRTPSTSRSSGSRSRCCPRCSPPGASRPSPIPPRSPSTPPACSPSHRREAGTGDRRRTPLCALATDRHAPTQPVILSAAKNLSPIRTNGILRTGHTLSPTPSAAPNSVAAIASRSATSAPTSTTTVTSAANDATGRPRPPRLVLQRLEVGLHLVGLLDEARLLRAPLLQLRHSAPSSPASAAGRSASKSAIAAASAARLAACCSALRTCRTWRKAIRADSSSRCGVVAGRRAAHRRSPPRPVRGAAPASAPGRGPAPAPPAPPARPAAPPGTSDRRPTPSPPPAPLGRANRSASSA